MQLESSKKLYKNIFFLYILVSLILAISISLNNYISHSELWAVASAKLFGQWTNEALVLYYKPLFYSLLKPFYFLPLDSLQHILANRLLFGILGWLCLCLFLYNIYLLQRSYQVCLLFGLFLLSFHIYFYNFYRIRADLITHLSCLLTYTMINYRHIKKTSFQVYDAKLMLLVLACFLSSPKGIYPVSMLVGYNILLHYKKSSIESLFLNVLFIFFLPIGLLLCVCHSFVWTGFIPVSPYTLALNYHLTALSGLLESSHWVHVLDSLQVNSFHYILIIFSIFYFVKQKMKSTSLLNSAQIFIALFALVIVLVHPEKWPYFIFTYVPFLSLPILFLINDFNRSRIAQIVFAALLIYPFLRIGFKQWTFSNQQQLNYIKNLEKQLTIIEPYTYYDSTGILPRQKSSFWFMGPHDLQSTQNALIQIENKKPEVIIYTSKLDLAAPEILVLLKRFYEEVEADLWIRRDVSNRHHAELRKLHLGPAKYLFIYDFRPNLKHPF